MLGGPTKVNVIEPSHAIKAMQRIPSTSIATVRPPTGGDEQHVGPTYTLGTASPRVCTGPGVRFFYLWSF